VRRALDVARCGLAEQPVVGRHIDQAAVEEHWPGAARLRRSIAQLQQASSVNKIGPARAAPAEMAS
jgi:hypothetical protein